jgi:hypothetical protein
MTKLAPTLLMVLAVPSLALAQKAKEPAAAPPAAPAPAPEVKKTADAFSGTWTFDGTVTGIPGTKEAVKVKENFVCRKAGGGRVVACSGTATVPGLGKLEDEALVTYDEEGKSIRFVGMSSTGEVHDHKCIWKDDKTMTCEPLAITVGGQPATVDFTATFSDPKNVHMVETTTLKDGSKMSFDGTGKRK